MTQQQQRVKRDGEWRRVEDAVDELPAETTEEIKAREELLEDAECCLADIDEVLDGCKPELTDEEILEKGHPEWRDYAPERYQSGEYESYDEYNMVYNEAEAQYEEAEKAFHEAYERLHGVAYEHGGCGCSW